MPHPLDALSDALDEAIAQMVSDPGDLRHRLGLAAGVLRELPILDSERFPDDYRWTLLPIIDRRDFDVPELQRLARDLVRIRDEVRKKVGKYPNACGLACWSPQTSPAAPVPRAAHGSFWIGFQTTFCA